MKQALLTQLRNRHTPLPRFRRASDQLASLLAADVAERVRSVPCPVETPLGETTGAKVTRNLLLVPVLRAGIALLPHFLNYFDEAKVGFLGIKRQEETAQAFEYYENLPPIGEEDLVIVLEPMIATGGTALLAIERLLKRGAREENLLFANLIASEQGLQAIGKRYARVEIKTIAVDPTLNPQKFIVPGLGDFGDRYYGT